MDLEDCWIFWHDTRPMTQNKKIENSYWLPLDLVQEAAKISYQKYYNLNKKMREEKIRFLRRIYRPTILNRMFEKELVNFFILHPMDDLDGERFVRLIEILPSDKIWNLQFAYSSWRPQISLAWNVYRRTLTNLDNSPVFVTEEEVVFLQRNSGIKMVEA